MLLKHKPPPPLSDFVDVLWLCEDYAVSHEKERLLPDGTVGLVVNLKEDRIRVYDPHHPESFHTIPGCVVSGPRSEFFVIDTEGESATVGVHFKPGGAFPFLDDAVKRAEQSVGGAWNRCGARDRTVCANGYWKLQPQRRNFAYWSAACWSN